MPPAPLMYPGFAKIVVSSVSPPSAVAAQPVLINISATWLHDPGTPETGLPTWMQIRIIDPAGNEMNARRAFVVPTRIDFLKKEADLQRLVTFPAPGLYQIVVDAAGHPEAEESAPVPFTVT